MNLENNDKSGGDFVGGPGVFVIHSWVIGRQLKSQNSKFKTRSQIPTPARMFHNGMGVGFLM
jgi:hypothetical protein